MRSEPWFLRYSDVGVGPVLAQDLPCCTARGLIARRLLGHPEVFLIRCAPAIDLVRQLPELRVERLQAVGRLEVEGAAFDHTDQPPFMRKNQASLELRADRFVLRGDLHRSSARSVTSVSSMSPTACKSNGISLG